MKKNLNHLIAQDIINIGINDTLNFSYIANLKDYMEDCDDEMKRYIKNHKNDIIAEIKSDTEKVADVDYDESSKTLDMVFYTNAVMNPLEQNIYAIFQDDEYLNTYETADAKAFANNLLKSKDFENYLCTKIFKKGEYEI